MTRTRRVLALTAALLVATAGLGACSSDSPTATTTPAVQATPEHTGGPVAGPHNTADVKYASSMFAHSQQSVELSQMATSKSANSKVKELADNIRANESPGMATLGGWLSGWGSQPPGFSDAPNGTAAGELTRAEVSKLGALPPNKFDKQWVNAMIKHQQNGITLSKKLLTAGSNPEAKKFAQTMIDTMGQQVTELKALVATL
jgi:uncharacterized protein (DUF305 family)